MIEVGELLRQVAREALNNYSVVVVTSDPADKIVELTMEKAKIPSSYKGIYILLHKYAEEVWNTISMYISHYGKMPTEDELMGRISDGIRRLISTISNDAKFLLAEEETKKMKIGFLSGEPISIQAPLELLDSLAKRMAHYHNWIEGLSVLISCVYCNGRGFVEIHPPRCVYCDGKGKMTCSKCAGKGTIPCDRCAGRGKVKCDKCEAGKVPCTNCNGRGYLYSGQICSVCGGTGRVNCPTCGGTGEVNCYKCDGQGELTCDACKGSGYVSCTHCGGRGYIGLARRQLCPICGGSGRIELREIEPGTYGNLLDKPEVFLRMEEEIKKALYDELTKELMKYVSLLGEDIGKVKKILYQVMIESRQLTEEDRKLYETIARISKMIEISRPRATELKEGRCPGCHMTITDEINKALKKMEEEGTTQIPVKCPFCGESFLLRSPHE